MSLMGMTAPDRCPWCRIRAESRGSGMGAAKRSHGRWSLNWAEWQGFGILGGEQGRGLSSFFMAFILFCYFNCTYL